MTEIIGLDHLYITVSDLQRSESFYDVLLMSVLNFRKNRFNLDGDAHIQYFNRHFGYVLRPARTATAHDAYASGLHHLCFRVASIEDVQTVAAELSRHRISVSGAAPYPQYASDYWATFCNDPDGLRLEITNYRDERRQRHDHWDAGSLPSRGDP